jgi:serine/threonine protein phosphatase PrpC
LVFPRIEAFGQSDAGCVREVNEDNFLCLDLSPETAGVRPASFLLAVADGIGGHAGGSVASAMAVQILREDIRKVDGIDPRTYLDNVFRKVNRMIYERASREPDHTGMGTTLVAAIGRGEHIFLANVGDSRAYLLRDGDLRQLTEDHSWAGEQRRRNLLSEQEIRRSPFRSMITRSLGYTENVAVDTFDVAAGENDVFLFCTDGLHGLVPEKRIARILKKHPEPKSACDVLIAAAKEAGGDDNVTAVVVSYRESKSGPTVRLSDTVRIPSVPEKS